MCEQNLLRDVNKNPARLPSFRGRGLHFNQSMVTVQYGRGGLHILTQTSLSSRAYLHQVERSCYPVGSCRSVCLPWKYEPFGTSSRLVHVESIKSGLLRRLHVRNILAARLSQVIHDKLKRWYTRLYVSRRAQTYPFLPSDNKYRIVCQCCSAVHTGMLGGHVVRLIPIFY